MKHWHPFLYLAPIYLQQKFTTCLSSNWKIPLKFQIPSGVLILHLVCKLNQGFSRLSDSHDYFINQEKFEGNGMCISWDTICFSICTWCVNCTKFTWPSWRCHWWNSVVIPTYLKRFKGSGVCHLIPRTIFKIFVFFTFLL